MLLWVRSAQDQRHDLSSRVRPPTLLYIYITFSGLTSELFFSSEICDGCAGRIGGARLVCLDCTPQSQETLDTIDLCDHPSCVSCTVPITRREDLDAPHLPTHHLMKLYTVLHMRQYGRVERAAREALKRVNRWIAAGLGARNAARHGAPGGVRTPMRTTFLPMISVNESGVDGMSVSTPLVEAREMFTCGKCYSPVTLPCWYCVVCPGTPRLN